MKPMVLFPICLVAVLVTKPLFKNIFRISFKDTCDLRGHNGPSLKRIELPSSLQEPPGGGEGRTSSIMLLSLFYRIRLALTETRALYTNLVFLPIKASFEDTF